MDGMRQDMQAWRIGMDRFRNTTQRQIRVLVGTVAFVVLTGVVKLVFFPS
jgi:hypothetical protein